MTEVSPTCDDPEPHRILALISWDTLSVVEGSKDYSHDGSI